MLDERSSHMVNSSKYHIQSVYQPDNFQQAKYNLLIYCDQHLLQFKIQEKLHGKIAHKATLQTSFFSKIRNLNNFSAYIAVQI